MSEEGKHWFEIKWTYTGTRRKRYRYERWREWDAEAGWSVKRSRYLGVVQDAPEAPITVPTALETAP